MQAIRGRKQHVLIVTVAALALAFLVGCGKKNDPKPPDPASTFPKTYPTGP